MIELVTYRNDVEVIVYAASDEQACIKQYFSEGGREISDYEREESKGPVRIISEARVRTH